MNLIKDDLKLMTDQIVSISIHDSKITHGDLEAVVFYRTQSTKDNSEPCESIAYDLIEKDEDVSWQSLLADTPQPKKNRKIISNQCTFRNVGEEKIRATVWVEGR